MKTITYYLLAITSCTLLGCSKPDASPTYTERVEQVFTRTNMRHEGCPEGGTLTQSGSPRTIVFYDSDRLMVPHKCTKCAFSNELYNVSYPQIKASWEPVK